jgi:FkbM family methyltransferase
MEKKPDNEPGQQPMCSLSPIICGGSLMIMTLIRSRARKLRHYLMPRSAFKRITAMQARSEIELSLLPALVDQNRAALDVGANAGVYSLHLSGLVSHVYAYEPHPRMAHILRASMPANVTVVEAAVSNVDGHAQLRFPINDGFEADVLGSIDSANTAVASTVFRTINVTTVRLDSLALANIGFIKIDVEGHELSVLMGAQDILRRDRPTLLLEAEERHRPKAVESVSTLLANHGYRGMFVLNKRIFSLQEFGDVYASQNAVESNVASPVNNFIFSHESQVSRVAKGIQQILDGGVPK